MDDTAAEERKRKRLEAWRLRQHQQQQELQQTQQQQQLSQPKPKVSLSLLPKSKSKMKNIVTKSSVPFSTNTFRSLGFGDDVEEDSQHGVDWNNRKKRKLELFSLEKDLSMTSTAVSPTTATITRHDAESNETTVLGSQRRRRWDNPSQTSTTSTISTIAVPSESTLNINEAIDLSSRGCVVDALDQYMENLETALVSPSAKLGVITAEELEILNSSEKNSLRSHHVATDSSNDARGSDDNEEQARRGLIEALKEQGTIIRTADDDLDNSMDVTAKEIVNDNKASRVAQLAAEVKSEKSRREERLRELELEAEQARKLNESTEPEFGRYLFDDTESGVMDEAERNLDAAKAAPDALTVLAELNKKKEIQAVDHASIDYMPFTANLYRVPRALANLKHEDVIDRRAKLKVRVRGHGAPAPLQTFEQSGLSEVILSVLRDQSIQEPFPVQAQCIPCIMGKLLKFQFC
jgi:hypothetical protein